MPRAVPPLLTFAGGELSPRLWARTDLDKYAQSVRTMRNMIALPQGPATRRPGTRFIAPTKNNGPARLIPFEFSTVQAYIIEAGEIYLRFYRDGGQILSGGVPYEVVTPYAAGDLAGLQWAQSADTLYIAHPLHAPRKLTRTGHTAWMLSTVAFQDGPYLEQRADIAITPSARTGSVTLTAGASLFSSADVDRLITLEQDTAARVANTAYSAGDVFHADDRGVFRVYRVIAAGTTAVSNPAGTTPNYDLNMPNQEGDSVTDGTAVLRYLGRGKRAWGWGTVTAFTSATQVTASFATEASLAATTASRQFRLGAWYTGNYPAAVSFHDERLWWASTPSQPQTLWASKAGDFEAMQDGAEGDAALTLTLADDQMNAIRWIRSGRALIAGTAGAEFALAGGGSGDDAVITPNNARARRQTTEGSAAVPAVQVGQSTIFVQRAARKLMELGFQFEADAFTSPELTVLAQHITRAGIAAMAWQPEPWRVLWCALADGALCGMTYMRDQRVVAWHRHAIGGGGLVRSIACIPSATSSELWLVVERTINGGTVRYVERLEPEFYGDAEADKRAAVFVDSAITYSGSPATVISGLGHLEAATVQVLADGAAHPDAVVASGSITLQRAASTVQIGLGYASRLETLDIDAGAADGTAATRRRRIGEIGVRLFQSLGCRVGYVDPDTGADVLEDIQFRTPAMPMDSSPPLFTGDKVLSAPSLWARECRVVVTQEQPLPLTVLGLVPRVTATE